MPRSRALQFHAMLLAVLICLLSTTAWGGLDSDSRLDELERSAGVKLHITRHSRTGAVRLLRVEPGRAIPRYAFSHATSADGGGAAAETAAIDFLGRYGSHFGIKKPSEELRVKRIRSADRGRSFVRLQQLHQGLPIIGGEVVVQLDAGNGIMSAHGKTSPDAVLDTAPGISATEAKEKALEIVAAQTGTDRAELSATEPELSVYDPALLDHREGYGRALVWSLEVKAAGSVTDQRICPH